MDISAFQTTQIQANASHHQAPLPPDPEQLREASQQFEAIFLRQFIDKSLAPLLADPMVKTDGAADIHRHMIADVLSESLSKQSVFGLADILELQLRPQTGSHNLTANNSTRQ